MKITNVKKLKFLEYKEVRALIDSIKENDSRDLRDKAVLEVLFSTGLRVAELVSLAKSEIHPATGEKTFEMSIIGKGGWQRVIFFSPKALNAVIKYLDWRESLPPGLFERDDARLFPMTDRAVQFMIKRRARDAGMDNKDITPHILRHSFATDLLRKGANIRIVQEFLGHRSISSTLVYTHTTNKDLKDLHNKFYK